MTTFPASIALVPGGQAANVAAWVCWLGGEARLVARRAGDATGRLIAAEIERLGVELSGPVIAGGTTGTVVALVAPDGTRTLASDRGAAGDSARTTSTRACWRAPTCCTSPATRCCATPAPARPCCSPRRRGATVLA